MMKSSEVSKCRTPNILGLGDWWEKRGTRDQNCLAEVDQET